MQNNETPTKYHGSHISTKFATKKRPVKLPPFAGSFIRGVQFRSEEETAKIAEEVRMGEGSPRHADETAGGNLSALCTGGHVLTVQCAGGGPEGDFTTCRGTAPTSASGPATSCVLITPLSAGSRPW